MHKQIRKHVARVLEESEEGEDGGVAGDDDMGLAEVEEDEEFNDGVRVSVSIAWRDGAGAGRHKGRVGGL